MTSTLSSLLMDYSLQDIFNTDETCVFCCCLPDKKLTFIMVASNFDGAVKLLPFIIGKYSRPHCFKNVQNLPLTYLYVNSKA